MAVTPGTIPGRPTQERDRGSAAEAVEELMKSRASGATPIRIQVNVYGEDGVDSSIHSLHLDPIKKGDNVLCWS